ncbi:MAG: radical SAM protein [Victivallales bacterium]
MLKYLFGPVSSRRLGISLGVDLVPSKTCSMDCIYCEAGRTTCLTLERREYYPTSEILGELGEFLSSAPKLDYITFSGAGEPTLHSGIGEIAGFIKDKYPQYKICLITNGSLLGNAKLAKELAAVDLVIPSLDAADEETFRKINRPSPLLNCHDFINSLVDFRKIYKANLWLEIFVVPGINDGRESVEAIRKAVARIRPDKVQLNSLDRPGTEKWVEKATEDELRPFVKALEPFVKVEIIGKPYVSAAAGKSEGPTVQDIGKNVLELVRRRPCTLAEIASAVSAGEDEVKSVLDGLLGAGRIKVKKMERGVFYCV